MNSKLFLLFILFLTISCSTTSHKATQKENSFSITKDQKNKCMQRIVYFKLLSSKASNSKYHEYLEKASVDTLCTSQYRTTIEFMDQHNDKIGILIEADPEYSHKTDAIIAGIKASLKDVIHQSKGSFVVKRVKKKKERVNRVLSDMIFDQKVGLIISWGAKDFVTHIQRWQKGLNIPGIFISNKLEKHESSFKIFPSRKNYALQFINTLKEKKIKKIAILTPSYLKETPLLKLLKYAIKGHGVEIIHDIEYEREQYETYDMACRSIFNIDRVERKEELDLIYAEEKLKAMASGHQLDEKHVFLPAKIDYDAIFIPDDFKTVLYFTKLFHYYQAKNVHLLGTYQWRSKDLLATEDQLLNGATFIDFLGDYDELPIEVPNVDAEKIVNKGFRTDYKLMGYYTGLIGQLALKASNNNKEKLTQELKNMQLDDKFLNNQKVFKENQFNWPSFAIEVKNNQFHIQTKR